MMTNTMTSIKKRFNFPTDLGHDALEDRRGAFRTNLERRVSTI